MKIYDSEIKDGLESQLSKAKSIAYVSKLLVPETKSIIRRANKWKEFLKTAASKDNMDLYPIDSLLVSVGWNKNDDVFDKAEVWVSRHTPEDKSFNYEHNATDIIGHIISNAAVDTDLNPIPDDIDPADLPDKFHIVTNSVVYKYLDNPEYLARMEQLIPEIEAGEWCVSMECLFNGFDYAVMNSKGEQKIIPRDEASAYLTKHLRSYGGTGKYQDYTVGRLLRNITFSGHGLVRNPANPESIIFNNVKNFSGSLATQVYFNSNLLKTKSEKSIMDGIDIKSLDAYAELKNECKRLEAELAKYNSEASKAELENLQKKTQADSARIADLEKELSTAKETIANLNTELTKSKDGASEYEKKYKDEVGKRTKAERVSLLVKANIPAEEIDGFLNQFGALGDEQFAAVVELAKSKYGGGQINTEFEGGSVETPKPPIGKDESKATKDAKKDKKKPPFMKDDDEDDADASTFDNVEETEDKTTAAFENLESAQAEIANELDSMMNAHRNRRNKK